MFCPSCGKELPEGSQFCVQCGKPTSSTPSTPTASQPQKKGIPPLRLIGYGLLFFLLVGAYWSQKERNERLRRSAETTPIVETPWRPQPHSVNLTNGAATVKATGYAWYKFTVPAGANSVAVNGHFTASGGTGNDIDCYIIDEDGFSNFQNGHNANTYYNSGKVTQAKIGAANLPAGTYYLVLDNRFSLLTPKAVQIQATLSYVQ